MMLSLAKLKGVLMEKSLYISVIKIITYAVVLVAALFNLSAVAKTLLALLGILSPILIALAIALVLNRPTDRLARHFEARLRRKKYARTLSMVLIYFSLLAIVIVLISFVMPSLSSSIRQFVDNLDVYEAQLSNMLTNMARMLNINQATAERIFTSITRTLDFGEEFLLSLIPEALRLTQNAAKVLLSFLLGLILSIYIVSDGIKMRSGAIRFVHAFFPERCGKSIVRIGNMSAESFSDFFVGQVTDSAILATLCFLGLSLLGLPYPLLISVTIGFTSLIPVVGAVLGCVPAVFVLFLENPSDVLIFLAFFIIIQQIDNNFIYPKVVGTSIGLPAFWVLIAIVIGGGLFGVVGMFISVPTMSVLYRLAKERCE